MPFERKISEGAGVLLDQMGALLQRPREIAILIAGRHHFEPASGSQAEVDLAEMVFPEKYNKALLHQPRSTASLYLRSGSDHLAGLGALFREREIFMAPGALARAGLEHAVRAVRLLDNRVGARQRSARAVLDNLVSANFSKLAVSHLGGKVTPSFATAKERFENIRSVAEECFNEVDLASDPFKWSVEGERYLRITEAVDEWGKSRNDGIPAEGIYDALSLYPHPQTFVAREEVQLDPESGDLHMETDIDTLRRISSAALAAWFDAIMVFITYHRWTVPEMEELMDAAAVLNTGQ